MKKERRVRVKASSAYDVIIAPGLLSCCGERIQAVSGANKAAIITDETVNALYGARVQEALAAVGMLTCSYVMPSGEQAKTMATLGDILQFLAAEGLRKTDVILALGGGVPGDVAGFAAACYLRGTPYVQLPTTWLSAVDSSVGGKTAVNLPAGKNLAGAFWQPILVLQDTDTLATLPSERLAEGMAETIKNGMICDAALFSQVAKGNGREMAVDIIARCVSIKAALVEQDEFDNGRRQLLNFGHTFGHAIEAKSGYTISHGQAVAMGMLMAARAAEKLGVSEESCAAAIFQALENNGLPTQCSYSAEALLPFAANDKKRRGDPVTLILPKKIGKCICHPVPVERLLACFRAGLEG